MALQRDRHLHTVMVAVHHVGSPLFHPVRDAGHLWVVIQTDHLQTLVQEYQEAALDHVNPLHLFLALHQ